MRFFKYFVIILMLTALICTLQAVHINRACRELGEAGRILWEKNDRGEDTGAAHRDFHTLWERHAPILQLYMEPNLMLAAQGAFSRIRGALESGSRENAAVGICEILDLIDHMYARERVCWQNIF